MAYEYDIEYDLDEELEYPKKYKVLLLNDDYSTMDFVIEVLMKIFKKGLEESTKIMLSIHNHGKEVCGVYSHEIAATKVAQVSKLARERGFPLKAILQEE